MLPQVPPLLHYAFGGLLLIVGALRAVYLGAARPATELGDETPARRRNRRYHTVVGIVWVLLGLFLVISKAVEQRSGA